MFTRACVVGAGRAGKALAARLAERIPTSVTGRELACGDADLVLLGVPDRAIADAAAAVPVGPWVTHVSGAVSVRALAPHRRRFALHPLQTFQSGGGPEQLDGAWGAVTGETEEAVRAGFALASLLGLRAFRLADEERPLYHAAATVAASFLVTIHEVATDLMEGAGAPPEALEPLMRRVIENGFAHTGPHVRGDRETIEAHLAILRARRPQLEPLYRVLADTTQRLLVR